MKRKALFNIRAYTLRACAKELETGHVFSLKLKEALLPSGLPELDLHSGSIATPEIN
ncbi:MAG: hypothetical protein ACOZDY_15755 [Pseudomonadota bacterium]